MRAAQSSLVSEQPPANIYAQTHSTAVPEPVLVQTPLLRSAPLEHTATSTHYDVSHWLAFVGVHVVHSIFGYGEIVEVMPASPPHNISVRVVFNDAVRLFTPEDFRDPRSLSIIPLPAIDTGQARSMPATPTAPVAPPPTDYVSQNPSFPSQHLVPSALRPPSAPLRDQPAHSTRTPAPFAHPQPVRRGSTRATPLAPPRSPPRPSAPHVQQDTAPQSILRPALSSVFLNPRDDTTAFVYALGAYSPRWLVRSVGVQDRAVEN